MLTLFLPTRLLVSFDICCMFVQQVTFAPSSSDAGRLIPFTDLIGYSGSPWGALGVMAALAARAPAWLAFQCGDHIAFEELNRLEACSIEVGFLRAVVAQWNHLMNAQHADFADLVPVLSSKWLDMEEPILQVRAVIDAGKEAEVDVGTLARVCRLQLRAVDFRPGNSSAAVQELARRLGPHEDAEERAFLLNLVLLLGYYAIGLLDSTENGPIAHAEPDESGCAACFLGSGDGEKGQCILS
uniref:Mannose-6-phosphate isomerase n=1 Tax=Heterosigma akashiwo TaxID=2829 RepID=A0A6V1PM61_HETAK|mmetsp:Transcript_1211/g.2335  ORF Transcript_1211/g.2335 Transcript_1211/m.2335 type:complete len:242 (-) Transcript_1211:177-902(-)